MVVVTLLSPWPQPEIAQTTVPDIKADQIPKIDPALSNPAAIPEAVVAVKKEPVTGIERVYCGSPKQRNWKNSNASNIAIGTRLAAERGWTGPQMGALKELWSCESSWTTTAGNTDSGAYGIPQSLPASKMAAYGDDYKVNPETQIKWGLEYIARRYKTPQAALEHHYAKNFY